MRVFAPAAFRWTDGKDYPYGWQEIADDSTVLTMQAAGKLSESPVPLTPGQVDAAQALASGAVKVVIGSLTQSNMRGQVDPTETIGGMLSRTAYPQAFRSLSNPELRFPISPAQSKYGGMWFRVYDDMRAAGWTPHIINSGIGSLSMIRDACGQVQTRANATAYRQYRAPEGPGDLGYAGDILVIQSRVFLCTTGVKAYCRSFGSGIELTGPTELDYIKTVGGQLTHATTEPPGFATAVAGDTVTDGTIVWTCLSATTTYNGYTYGAGNALNDVRRGFDPFGLLHDLVERVKAVPGDVVRLIHLANAQSDVGSANLLYQQSLEALGAFVLKSGLKLSLGLECYQPSAGTTAYNNLTTRVNGALTNLRALAAPTVPSANFDVADVITGPNFYTLMGSTGPMAAGGAYFLKDVGMDDIHLNSPGQIESGRLGAVSWLASLAPFA